jgi:hypothetical protein
MGVAIDPTAATGAPERSVAELLWTRADELAGPRAITDLLDTFAESGQLDRAKAVAWGFVRSIDSRVLSAGPVAAQRIRSPPCSPVQRMRPGGLTQHLVR